LHEDHRASEARDRPKEPQLWFNDTSLLLDWQLPELNDLLLLASTDWAASAAALLSSG